MNAELLFEIIVKNKLLLKVHEQIRNIWQLFFSLWHSCLGAVLWFIYVFIPFTGFDSVS